MFVKISVVFILLLITQITVPIKAQDIYRKTLAEYQKQAPSDKRDSAILSCLFNLSKLRQPGMSWDDSLKRFSINQKSRIGNLLWKLKYVEKEITNLNYSIGIDSIIKIAKTLEKFNQKSYASFAYLRAGIVYVYASDDFLDKKNAFAYYKKALALATESDDKTEIIRAYDYIGELYFEMDDFKNAIFYLTKAKNLVDNNGDKYMYPSITASLSASYFQIGNKKESDYYLKNANYWLYDSEMKFDSLYKVYINYIYQKGVASYYLKQKQYDKAIAPASQGLKRINESLKGRKRRVSKFEVYSMELLKILYLSHSAKGEYREAFFYLQDLNTKQYIHQKSELNGVFQELNHKYQTEQKQQEINKLELEKSRVKLQNQQKTGYLLFGILAILTMSLGYFAKLNKELKQKNKEISEAMLKGQTIERQRVALDLHDNLGSTLSALWLSVDMIDKSKMNEEEKTIHQNLRENLEKAYNDVRLLSHNLLPEEFEKQGLTIILQGFVRKMNKNSAIKFDLKISENFGRVNNKIEFELYSICLELVNNIIKHSKATEAKIELSRNEKQILFIVSDNGIGTFKNDSDGKGMKNVKARVESLNGVWELQSVDNEGVKNKILIPV